MNSLNSVKMLTTKLVNLRALLPRVTSQLKLGSRLYASQAKYTHNCIVSTVGSQSSGKTTLTDALRTISAEQQNSSPEPVINSGTGNSVFSRYQTDSTRIVHIDADAMPPKNLLTGSFGTDIGLLVVDASKGLDDQAKEHIVVLAYQGIRDFIVYLNKSDLNDDAQLRGLMIDEIKEFFAKFDLNLSDDSIVHGSALNAVESGDSQADRQSVINVLKLIETKCKSISREEQMKGPALFSIKRSHSKANKGVEVTGFMNRGVLRKGDTVNICGYDRLFKTKVLEIESFKEQLDCVHPGLSTALLLKSIKREDVYRGMAIYHPDNNNIQISDHFRAKIHYLPHVQKGASILVDDMTLQLFARTFDIRTIIKVENEQKTLSPGETGTVKFKVCSGQLFI